MSKIFMASDHAAYEQKEALKNYLQNNLETTEVIDLGTNSSERVDYPDFGKKVATKVLENSGSRGIALCGSGIGIQIQVNRFKGIRGAVCKDIQTASLSRSHNDSNVLCLAARLNTSDEIVEIVNVWLNTEFEGGRHADRVKKLDESC